MTLKVPDSSPSLTSWIKVDNVLHQRAQQQEQRPVIAYPRNINGSTEFELFSAKDLSCFVDHAVTKILDLGLKNTNREAVALIGRSTLDYVVTMLALSRLGYAVVLLSPRLAFDATISLLRDTNCRFLFGDETVDFSTHDIEPGCEVQKFPILSRKLYDTAPSDPPALSFTNQPDDALQVAYIMHSAGSTGNYPKPIFQTHQACLANYSTGYGVRTLSTVPLYHTSGHASLFRTIFHGGTIYLPNASQPSTSMSLISMLEDVRPEVIFVVPYTLKLLAESQRGIRALKNVKLVSSAGGPCPDEIGNLLVENGVNLVSLYGATEVGQIMNSSRPKGDNAWDYMRPLPSAKPYVHMRPVSGSSYELVILDGLKSKTVSNSHDPPNSYHTGDLFISHPTIPCAWKYIGRIDDRIILVNGEKVLPLAIEGCIRQSAAVREAVVVGADRDVPGLLVFRSSNAEDLLDDAFITAIWPFVEEANSRADQFSQISRETIIPCPANMDYPRTDKGTIIRAQVYRAFAIQIAAMYERLQGNRQGGRWLSEEELQMFLITVINNSLGIHLEFLESDFFLSGLNSLKAIHLASHIKKEIYLQGKSETVNQNMIYACRNVRRLARSLYALQIGQEDMNDKNELDLVEKMIQRYSEFPGCQRLFSQGQIVLLTGATGSLGSYVLAHLLTLPHIKQIYCLVRSRTQQSPLEYLLSTLRARQIHVDLTNFRDKVTSVTAEFSKPLLDIPAPILDELRARPLTIFHTAWNVNFNLGLANFEAEDLTSTKVLLDLSLSVHTKYPARFVFCSSISTALAAPSGSIIAEALLTTKAYVQPSGYARSKFVAEHMIAQAAKSAGADVCVLRIGQIAGDATYGIWNEKEAIPMIIKSAATVGVLPALNETCRWIPVDYCAQVVVELGLAPSTEDMKDTSNKTGREARFYNVCSPHEFHWTRDLLPLLAESGLSFDVVPTEEWLRRLESSSDDGMVNPCAKLLPFWKEKLARNRSQEEYGSKDSEVSFSTELAMADSANLRDLPQMFDDSKLLTKFVEGWLEGRLH